MQNALFTKIETDKYTKTYDTNSQILCIMWVNFGVIRYVISIQFY